MENYNNKREKNEKRNKKFINEFIKWLENKNLNSKTIKKHISNVDFYLNTYLVYYEVYEMESGCFELGGYFSDFFIRKCMWSTPYSTKTTASSIKKFYQCMSELGYVSVDDYKYLCNDIKENLEYWMDEVERYNTCDEDWFYNCIEF